MIDFRKIRNEINHLFTLNMIQKYIFIYLSSCQRLLTRTRQETQNRWVVTEKIIQNLVKYLNLYHITLIEISLPTKYSLKLRSKEKTVLTHLVINELNTKRLLWSARVCVRMGRFCFFFFHIYYISLAFGSRRKKKLIYLVLSEVFSLPSRCERRCRGGGNT